MTDAPATTLTDEKNDTEVEIDSAEGSVTEGTAPLSAEDKREELRRKIAEAEERNRERTLAERASEATDSVREFVTERPLTSIGAGLAAGVILAAIFTPPGRRLSRQAGARASGLAATASELAAVYAAQVADAAGDLGRGASDRFEDLSDDLGQSARSARRRAAFQAGSKGDTIRSAARRARKRVSRTARDTRRRFD